ncbi:hypothetical protein PRABACTJOHN_02992 [Parabacteroides johnsonii DSM 18315]|uniref:Uncharacterized protein n=1 Tax=Parabacteroides johnsonii DSM 18315 TaxID=537006 RepID=B7BD71_9BACT|nr:hypothetical protein PRABACTJOHN_02992 [Parabacteroides johnsonii DSM 18315]
MFIHFLFVANVGVCRCSTMVGKFGGSGLYENHTPVCMIFIQPFSVPLSPLREMKKI